ncbi:PREDICTED: uncharacterized protein LOC105107609 [Populus euphratica]|uniref:Uncharacterized protein LOC105107609 n=1 Tax=Populus euphratica TaxID=75702 RepID=A0AAJ6SWN4_POPEU|nr:PREDICTED: uncharacterized protein LOC105107609 [Populus euphratica]
MVSERVATSTYSHAIYSLNPPIFPIDCFSSILARFRGDILSISLTLSHTLLVQIPANSMEGPSELVGGDQNDQTVQPSAEDIRKEKRRLRDYRRGERKQQEIERTQRELGKWKADYAELEKNNAYLRGKLELFESDMEQTRETNRRLVQIVGQQNIMINMLQILIEMTPRNTFGTGEADLQVHHPPVYQFGTTMVSGGSTMQVSSGLLQSPVPQGWAHGNNVEQPSLTSGGDLFVNLNHLNNTYPPRTAMASGSSPRQGSPVPQGQAHENNNEQPGSTYGDQFFNFNG